MSDQLTNEIEQPETSDDDVVIMSENIKVKSQLNIPDYKSLQFTEGLELD